MTYAAGESVVPDLALRGLPYQVEIRLRTLDIVNQTLNCTMKISYTFQMLSFSTIMGKHSDDYLEAFGIPQNSFLFCSKKQKTKNKTSFIKPNACLPVYFLKGIHHFFCSFPYHLYCFPLPPSLSQNSSAFSRPICSTPNF